MVCEELTIHSVIPSTNAKILMQINVTKKPVDKLQI